jgi:hypothetical protein
LAPFRIFNLMGMFLFGISCNSSFSCHSWFCRM